MRKFVIDDAGCLVEYGAEKKVYHSVSPKVPKWYSWTTYLAMVGCSSRDWSDALALQLVQTKPKDEDNDHVWLPRYEYHGQAG